MIVEKAEVTVTEGQESAFAQALIAAREQLVISHGFRRLTVGRGVERSSTYLLLIEWESLADHVDGFRNSPAFTVWRSLIGPFFAEPPFVEHFESVPELGLHV